MGIATVFACLGFVAAVVGLVIQRSRRVRLEREVRSHIKKITDLAIMVNDLEILATNQALKIKKMEVFLPETKQLEE